MKKLAILAVSVAALLVAGWGRYSTYERTTVSSGYIVMFSPGEVALINVWTDPVTGCESYVTDDGFITPRLNPDGMQRCVKVTK